MFSLGKLLVFGLILVALVLAFRVIGRLGGRGDRGDRGDRKVDQQERPGVTETEACPVCGTFVARQGAKSCGRPGCPY